MDERAALKNAIAEAPGDDAPRLVFADWLEENGNEGDAELAEFIRVQVELARMEEEGRGWPIPFATEYIESPVHFPPADDVRPLDPEAARRIELLTRNAELTKRLDKRARAEFPAPAGVRWHVNIPCRRGFPSCLEATSVPRLVRSAANIRATLPIRSLQLAEWPRRPARTWATDLAASGLLGHVSELRLFHTPSTGALRELLHRPELAGLRSLCLYHLQDTPGAVAALAEAVNLTGLRKLDVGGGYEGADPVTAGLFANPALRGMQELEWDGDNVGEDSGRFVRALASAGWDRLEDLLISEECAGDDLARALARVDGLPALRRVGLLGVGLGALGATALLTSEHLGRLGSLDLSGAALGDLGPARLGRAKAWPPLRVLDLSDCQLAPSSLRSLTRWPGFTGLWKLALADSLSGEGTKVLADAPASPNLRTLVLRNCGLDRDDARVLAGSRLLGSLLLLDLRGNTPGADGARALAESAHLDGLAVLLMDRKAAGKGWQALQKRFGERLRSG